MALPELIEIVPLDKPVRAEITVPGSKSITNRALILAALADGEVILCGALWSQDTQIMVECLQKLGFEIRIENDPEEFCNRTITVKGLGGKIPNAGTIEKPLELFVGNAGTAARFLSAFVCLGDGVYRLSGVPRMHERPQAALFQALQELGYRVESENGNDKLPVKIFGGRSRGDETQIKKVIDQRLLTSSPTKKCKVSIEESSQFASALLLCAKVGNWKIEIVGENAEESPYVAMTSKIIEVFPKSSGTFQIEPDASSGSYFWAAAWYVIIFEWVEFAVQKARPDDPPVRVKHWPKSGWQIDADFPHFIPPPEKVSRETQLGDSIMTAIVLAADKKAVCGVFKLVQPFFFTDLGRLRVQETERVVALRTELTKCGAKVVEEGDTLTVWPSPLHGAEIETYNDHRMAMCFAILGLKVSGIKIKNPACVKKTFPNFFQKLAAHPPKGLGATILDAKTGRKLTHEELFAD
ncbi:MAG TPA: 3-phosphoshikimate 1-carboxyvinyltransferase [Verrucomicrobiae bacterium]|nr:3-phosphoshikimate 1-carboxyvinyltransferase [Verrucomicrobiae bacterium]